MFAVEVQDAKGRTVPITDNLVTFRVTGPGKLIGVGNGDPTDQAPDKGASRKAFSGYCMALVQSAKKAGTITVEASSPGLTSASATVSCKQAELRPQIAVWERSIPKGSGITGLWRPIPEPGLGTRGLPRIPARLHLHAGWREAQRFRRGHGRLLRRRRFACSDFGRLRSGRSHRLQIRHQFF